MKVIANGEHMQPNSKREEILQNNLCNHNLYVSLQNKIHHFTETLTEI